MPECGDEPAFAASARQFSKVTEGTNTLRAALESLLASADKQIEGLEGGQRDLGTVAVDLKTGKAALSEDRVSALENAGVRDAGQSLGRSQPDMGRAKEPEKTPEPKSADRDLGL